MRAMVKKPRVLLADDHESVRRGVRSVLESEFDVVAAVPNGEAALQAAETLRPDVVVLDVEMPVLGGMEAARRLLERWPGARIVFLSIHRTPGIVGKALSTGALGYVFKTSADEDLAPAIRDALEGRSFVSSAE
mgnify:CR=1 FL=1